MTTVIKVLDLMREIERANHATQNWWPSLKRLLEQQEAVELRVQTESGSGQNDQQESEITTDV